MTTYGTTPNYGIQYPQPGTLLVDLAAVLAAAAATIDAALARGGIVPPNSADLAALAGRVSVLEQRPYAELYQGTAQTNLPAGWQTITLDQEAEDSHGGHAAGGIGYTVPAGQGGLYFVSGAVAFAPGSTAELYCQARILLAGSNFHTNWGTAGRWLSATASQPAILAVPAKHVRAAAGQTITLQGSVDGAGWATSFSGAGSTAVATSYMSIHRVA